LNITQLGTVTTGIWNAGDITVPYGGTGATSFTANGVLLGNGAGALGVTATGTSGYLLTSNGGAAPTWNQINLGTSAAITGQLTVANGGTGDATLTANGVLIGNGTSALTATATVANAVLVTNGSGAPSESTTIPNATQLNITAVGTITTGVWNAGAVTSSGKVQGTFFNATTAANGYQLNGTSILYYPDSGNDTTSLAVGASALASQTTLNLGNTGVGYQALKNTTTVLNTALGYEAGQNVSSGANNTFIGAEAGLASSTTAVTGNSNTGIGALALTNLTGTANNNTALGYNAGGTMLTTGAGNILIGANTDTPAAGTSNWLNRSRAISRGCTLPWAQARSTPGRCWILARRTTPWFCRVILRAPRAVPGRGLPA